MTFWKRILNLVFCEKLDYNTPTCHFSNFVFVLCVKSIFVFIGNLEASRCDLIDANSQNPLFIFMFWLCLGMAVPFTTCFVQLYTILTTIMSAVIFWCIHLKKMENCIPNWEEKSRLFSCSCASGTSHMFGSSSLSVPQVQLSNEHITQMSPSVERNFRRVLQIVVPLLSINNKITAEPVCQVYHVVFWGNLETTSNMYFQRHG